MSGVRQKTTTEPPRRLVWFSCGAASACVAKLVSAKHKDKCEILYCDTLAYEHPDNLRFIKDVEKWIGKEIKILKSHLYTDIFDVFRRHKYINGITGAKCTTKMKQDVRKNYQNLRDVHFLGLCVDEQTRIKRFEQNNPDLFLDWYLVKHNMTKQDCIQMVKDAGIELPTMYKLGYNNNCIGCVKGGKGYWNKIRRDFPESFERMAKLERELNSHCLPYMYLDELSLDAGMYETDIDVECGIACGSTLDQDQDVGDLDQYITPIDTLPKV